MKMLCISNSMRLENKYISKYIFFNPFQKLSRNIFASHIFLYLFSILIFMYSEIFSMSNPKTLLKDIAPIELRFIINVQVVDMME